VSPVDLLIAAGVALLAGAINSIAGGGSLILFPTLIGLGLGTVPANVTNSVAQWPGYVGGVLGFRREYEGQRSRLIRFSVVAVVGGTVGSVLLLTTPSEAFDTVVPILVFLASVLLAFQPLMTKRLKKAGDGVHTRDPVWLYVALFLATVYGGYFGGALGVILVGHRDRRRLRPFRPGLLALRRRLRPGQPARRVPRRQGGHPHPERAAAGADRRVRRQRGGVPVPPRLTAEDR
jgi:uncharacterized protein